MKIEVQENGAFSSALVKLSDSEQFRSEAGAMFRCSSNVQVDVSIRESGGFLSGLKRKLAGESFFFSTYTSEGGDGEIGLAPTLQGEVRAIACDGSRKWLCSGGSYLGSSIGLQIDTKFQGFKGMFSGESLSFIEVSGEGELLVSAFGRINALDVAGHLVVDSGHVVAFEDSLEYSVQKAAGGWVQSFLSGEGLVLSFKGSGKIYVQSHNPSEFGGALGPLLPARG